MDLKDLIKQLAEKINQQKENILTEEATKNASVMLGWVMRDNESISWYCVVKNLLMVRISQLISTAIIFSPFCIGI